MNKRGQSIIEYALIAVLVILGIYFMGPYVLRSVGAHFKLWDEGVQDSFTENLNQAPINDVSYIPTNCTCQPDSSSGCGNSLASSQCGSNQSIWNHSCNPLGCDGAPASYCKNDDACCKTYFPENCGTVSCPGSDCSSAPTSPPPTSSNCYFGQRIYATQCSDLPIECETDSTCKAVCLGVLSPGGLYCATRSTVAPTDLNQNYSITYVATCPSSSECQAYCGPGYLLSLTGTACLRTFTVAAPTDSTGYGGAPCPASSGCVIDTNPQSFAMCAGSSITAISIAANPTNQEITSPIAIPTGTGEDGCQNPNASGVDEGEPGTTCQITTTY